MKDSQWLTPNRMKFDSQHKTFNRQVNCISHGNVFAATQTSSYVRAFNTLECNGRINAPGHLQEWDLTQGALKNFDDLVKSWIRANVRDKDVVAYQFYHYRGKRKIVHGYVITSGYNDGHKLIRTFYWRNTEKSRSVIDEAIKYITN